MTFELLSEPIDTMIDILWSLFTYIIIVVGIFHHRSIFLPPLLLLSPHRIFSTFSLWFIVRISFFFYICRLFYFRVNARSRTRATNQRVFFLSRNIESHFFCIESCVVCEVSDSFGNCFTKSRLIRFQLDSYDFLSQTFWSWSWEI